MLILKSILTISGDTSLEHEWLPEWKKFFIVERNCFNLFINDYEQYFCRTNGYVYIGNQSLHLKVLGREIGQYVEDGLQGCHGPGGVLDNRKRTLALGSASLNSSHIIHVRADPTIPPGVTLVKNRWLANISLNGEMFYLYSYPTKEEASTCYKSVQAKRDEILSLLTDMNDKQERVNLVKSYATNPNPPVYSSEYRGVYWFKALKKWRARISFSLTISGKKTYVEVSLGLFVNELEAKYVYDCINSIVKIINLIANGRL